MAWQDKPTENQICALAREYDAVLYDRVGEARDQLGRDLTKDAARLVKTRRQISQEIDLAARKGVIGNHKVRKFLEAEFKKNNINVKLEEKDGE